MDTGRVSEGVGGPERSGSRVTDIYSESASLVCLRRSWTAGKEADSGANYPSWVALSSTLGTGRQRAGLSGQAAAQTSRRSAQVGGVAGSQMGDDEKKMYLIIKKK